MTEPVSILIPSYDNVEQLRACLQSIINSGSAYPVDIIVINNGKAPLDQMFKGWPIKIINPGENLGWEGGLKEGLKHTTSKYVMFANDDIFIPRSSFHWLQNMTRLLESRPDVGAVGPSSNVVMGPQNIFLQPYNQMFQVQFLIGFCVLFRRSALDDIGGIDDTLPGGDDIDYSIRLRLKKWKMAVLNDVFVYHHGFQTGIRLHGDHTKPNGWNSQEMTERTNAALIKKHGFLNWWETMTPQSHPGEESVEKDKEGEAIKELVSGETVELGCGATKTVPDALGVDRVPKGEVIPWMQEAISVADVVADVSEPLPFEDGQFDTLIARHVLEHCLDTITILKEWARIVKAGGKLLIAVPNQKLQDSITLNPEHLHAFTPGSLRILGEASGLIYKETIDPDNAHSFIINFEKA
jgi:glycosyltransferase involved in cell wall biosynthesis